MAYTDLMGRRDYGTSSLFQRCEKRYGCPPLEDGPLDPDTGKPKRVRPEHDCKGRWFGQIEAGSTADGTRRHITISDAKKSVAQRRQVQVRVMLQLLELVAYTAGQAVQSVVAKLVDCPTLEEARERARLWPLQGSGKLCRHD